MACDAPLIQHKLTGIYLKKKHLIDNTHTPEKLTT